MIIVLNGPINSGKTTLAKLLAEKIEKTAIVEVDSVHEFYPKDDSEGWEKCYRAAISLAEGFAKEGLNVIFSYHIVKDDFEKIKERLSVYDQKIFAFTLKPTLEVLLKNRGNRELNEYLTNKIKKTYNSPEYFGDYGIVIDNSGQSAEEVAEVIIKHVTYN
jgi:deoxyadenosine/deoxycytidine kinase